MCLWGGGGVGGWGWGGARIGGWEWGAAEEIVD